MIKLISEVEAEEKATIRKELAERVLMQSQDFATPIYHTAIYPHLYKDKKWFTFFNSRTINNIVSCFTREKIINSFIEEIYPASKVLQMGITFGDEIKDVAEQIGYNGRFDIIDINNAQITFAQEYLGDDYPQIKFYHYNAETPLPEKYDTIICYMLLHEVPIVSKMKIVNNALNSIKEDGKVIFVDYGRPNMLHPFAYIVRMFNRLKQPFAEKLWDREIASFAERDLEYHWKKVSFLGGLYQRIIVTRKSKDQIRY